MAGVKVKPADAYVVAAEPVVLVDPTTGAPYAAAGGSFTAAGTATAAAPSYSEGTSNPLSMDLGGALRVTGSFSASSTATATAAAPAYGEGTSQPFSQNLSGDLRVIAKQSGTYTVSGTVAATQSGTWNVGSITTLPALAAGANTIGSIGNTGFQSTGNVAHDAADSGNPVKVGARATSAAPTAVANGDRSDLFTDLFGSLRTLVVDTAGAPLDYTVPALVAGGTAADAALTNAPVTTGGLAKTANPTAVADGDVVNTLHDKLGKVIAVSAVRDLKGVQHTTITASTSETTIVTAVASTFLDVYGIIIANSSATATEVTIKDATAGTTRATIAVPANASAGFMLDAGSAIPQAAVNNNWTATAADSVSSLFITALYVKNT